MRKNFISLAALILLAAIFLLAGCAKTEKKVPAEKVDKFVIQSSSVNHEFPVEELKTKFTAVTADVISISSSGERNEMTVAGVPLRELLAYNKIDLSSFSSIRAVAGDGYSIEIPEEVMQKRKIILAYKINGKFLNEESKPIRVIVPDERAMYWARNVVKIELLEKKDTITTEKIVFLETAYKNLPQKDYMYYESMDKIVPVKDLLATYCEDCEGELHFDTKDGLKRSETKENALISFIKISGIGKPLFLSPDLPGGMYIKDITSFKMNNTCFYSIENSAGSEKISADKLLNSIEMTDSDNYIITDINGKTTVLNADKLKRGTIQYKDNNAVINLSDKSVINKIISIEIKN